MQRQRSRRKLTRASRKRGSFASPGEWVIARRNRNTRPRRLQFQNRRLIERGGFIRAGVRRAAGVVREGIHSFRFPSRLGVVPNISAALPRFLGAMRRESLRAAVPLTRRRIRETSSLRNATFQPRRPIRLDQALKLNVTIDPPRYAPECSGSRLHFVPGRAGE